MSGCLAPRDGVDGGPEPLDVVRHLPERVALREAGRVRGHGRDVRVLSRRDPGWTEVPAISEAVGRVGTGEGAADQYAGRIGAGRRVAP